MILAIACAAFAVGGYVTFVSGNPLIGIGAGFGAGIVIMLIWLSGNSE